MSNQISFVGRLGADAETKMNGDNFICEFNVAEDVFMGKTKDKNTNWYKCALWNNYGKTMCPHLVKGAAFQFRGELVLRKYEKDGIKHIAPELKDIKIDFIPDNKKKES